MATQRTVGVLGTPLTAYLSAATATSDTFFPRPHSTTVTIACRASTAGTARAYLVDLDGNEHAQGVGAVAASAAGLNVFILPLALDGIAGVVLKFTDTSAGAGTVTFYASDGV